VISAHGAHPVRGQAKPARMPASFAIFPMVFPAVPNR
jgi:hypothetical protein